MVLSVTAHSFLCTVPLFDMKICTFYKRHIDFICHYHKNDGIVGAPDLYIASNAYKNTGFALKDTH